MWSQRSRCSLSVTTLVPVILSLGCAASAPRHIAESPFSSVHTEAVRSGMHPAEVQALFGAPTAIYSRQFGEAVAEPWLGVVYEYLGDEDPRFRYETRELRHRFVFALIEGDSLLNHWVLDPALRRDAGEGVRR